LPAVWFCRNFNIAARRQACSLALLWITSFSSLGI
jgi:hypothetical protein